MRQADSGTVVSFGVNLVWNVSCDAMEWVGAWHLDLDVAVAVGGRVGDREEARYRLG